MISGHKITTCHEGNDHFLRCECGSEMSTDTGVSNHLLGVQRDQINRLRSNLADLLSKGGGYVSTAYIKGILDGTYRVGREGDR